MMPQAEVQRLRPESIHPSEWKENSPKLNFRFTEFSDVLTTLTDDESPDGKDEPNND
jgi:hypothetical protein